VTSDLQTVRIGFNGGENVGAQMIRDPRGTMERDNAPMALFITLTPPRLAMKKEAASAGLWESQNWRPVPRIELRTIEGLLSNLPGVQPARIPMARRDTYKKAARETRNDQRSLDL
jgi:site-specific DNA-methyltransferase (adenine-specific)